MRFLFSAMMTTSLAFLSVSAAAGQSLWATVGTLECTMGPGTGVVIDARQQARCTFKPRAAINSETYRGRVERPDPAPVMTDGKLVWVVLSSDGVPPLSLFGRYSNAWRGTAGAVMDAAAALCRNSQRTICLQPLADADHEDGDNLAVGITAMRLE